MKRLTGKRKNAKIKAKTKKPKIKKQIKQKTQYNVPDDIKQLKNYKQTLLLQNKTNNEVFAILELVYLQLKKLGYSDNFISVLLSISITKIKTWELKHNNEKKKFKLDKPMSLFMLFKKTDSEPRMKFCQEIKNKQIKMNKIIFAGYRFFPLSPFFSVKFDNKDYANVKTWDKNFIAKLNNQPNAQIGVYFSIILGYENSILIMYIGTQETFNIHLDKYLEENLKDNLFIKEDVHFHKTKMKYNEQTMIFPEYGQDLNPTNCIFTNLHKKIYENINICEWNDINLFMLNIINKWENFSKETLKEIYLTFSERINMCLDSDGELFPYEFKEYEINCPNQTVSTLCSFKYFLYDFNFCHAIKCRQIQLMEETCLMEENSTYLRDYFYFELFLIFIKSSKNRDYCNSDFFGILPEILFKKKLPESFKSIFSSDCIAVLNYIEILNPVLFKNFENLNINYKNFNKLEKFIYPCFRYFYRKKLTLECPTYKIINLGCMDCEFGDLNIFQKHFFPKKRVFEIKKNYKKKIWDTEKLSEFFEQLNDNYSSSEDTDLKNFFI